MAKGKISLIALGLLTCMLLVSPVYGEEITIFGEIKENLDAGATFDLASVTHPSILYYDFDEGYGLETLDFDVDTDLEIPSSTFLYTTQVYPRGTNSEPYIAWLGTPYYVISSSNDWYLGQLLVDEDEDDSYKIAVGDTLPLGAGYTLIPEEIDVNGEVVLFSLYKDGEGVASNMISEDEWFLYELDLDDDCDKDDFVVKFYIELVFNGMESNMVEITSLQIVSEDVLYLDLPDDDLFSGYDITSPDSTMIIVEADDDIDLKKDGSVDILGGRFQFKVNDDGTVGGIVKVVDLDNICPECPDCPTCPDCPDCPDVGSNQDCPECPDKVQIINEYKATQTDTPVVPVTPVPTEPMSIPGFSIISAILGILALAYFANRK